MHRSGSVIFFALLFLFLYCLISWVLWFFGNLIFSLVVGVLLFTYISFFFSNFHLNILEQRDVAGRLGLGGLDGALTGLFWQMLHVCIGF